MKNKFITYTWVVEIFAIFYFFTCNIATIITPIQNYQNLLIFIMPNLTYVLAIAVALLKPIFYSLITISIASLIRRIYFKYLTDKKEQE